MEGAVPGVSNIVRGNVCMRLTSCQMLIQYESEIDMPVVLLAI
jgi:hypothetical protein